MGDPFLERLAVTAPKRRALVAVSGGRDSVALLHGLHALGRSGLTVIHLDHGLRGRASGADARFVTRIARKLGLPFASGRADVRGYATERGLSLEHAARELRHVFFTAIARRTRIRTVLLAHHADDQVETCLHNFLRGTGAAGLAGMRAEVPLVGGPTLVRPLLSLRRADIDAYVIRHRIKFREDATNAEPAATRNRLRHRVLPAIYEAVGDSAADAILRTAEILGAEEAWMQTEAARFPLGPELPVAGLRELPLALVRRVLRCWLAERLGGDVTFDLVERVRSLLAPGAAVAKVNLPGDQHARRRSGVIFIE